MNVVAPLAIGFAFGWLLQRGGLSRYDRIVNIYRFRDLAVLRVLLAAIATGAVLVVATRALGWLDAAPVPTTLLGAALLGGVVFGMGMALSGFCPGTIAAGAGEGRLDYLIAGSLGIYTGVVAFGLAWPRLAPALAHVGALGITTLPRLLGVSPWLFTVLLAEIAALVLYAVARIKR